MRDTDQDRRDKAAKAAEFRRERDDNNLQMAGYQTGRLPKSFNQGGLTAEALKEKKEKDRQSQRLLRRALGISFEDRLTDLSDNITLTETASYEALIEARDARDFVFNALKALQANAHVHPDGRRVYLSEDGSYAIDENFERLSEPEMTALEWKEGKITAEQFTEGHQNLQDADLKVREIEQYRERVERASERLESGEIDTDVELNELDGLIAEAPAAVAARMNTNDFTHQLMPSGAKSVQITRHPSAP
ncbi:MAG: hypothetical protein AAFW83_14565 [Pseudomonadota bacterium]